MKISVLLPYKENFSSVNAGAVSLFVKDTIQNSKFSKNSFVFGNMTNKKPFLNNYVNIELNRSLIRSNSKNYVQKKFTDEIAALIQNCDLVISRSGAGTINELIETEKPSILIPYPYSKNNHQEKNAMILAESGGSVLMNQNKISKEVFEETIERIFKRKSKNGKYYYEILDIMKKNMENNNKIKSKIEIRKFFNYFLKEF